MGGQLIAGLRGELARAGGQLVERLHIAVAVPHLLLAAYCGGLLLSLVARVPTWLALSVALVVFAAALGGRRRSPLLVARWLFTLLIAAALVGAGLGVGSWRLQALADSQLAAFTGRTVPIACVLTDLPAIADDQVTLAVAVTEVDGGQLHEPAHLRLRLDRGQRYELDPAGPLTEGALLKLAAVRVRPLPEARPERFDYGRYLRRRGEHVLLEAAADDLVVLGRRGGLWGATDALRRASRRHLAAGVHGQVGAVLQGMVLGDDEGVSAEVIAGFRRSGLLHIMAVSGENVVLLCTMWGFLFSLLAIPRLWRTVMLIPVVLTYVVLTGASPSIVRAGVAGVVTLLAILASRPSDGWLVWLVPGAWLLSVSPYNLFDVSFQLSFGAVVGLLVLARPLTRAFRFLPGPFPEMIGVTTAASIATAPISLFTFGSTSVASLPANVVGGFVLGPIMFLGMLSLLAGFVSLWASLPLNLLAGLFIGFLLAVARLFGRPWWAVYEWHGVTAPVVVLAVVLASLLAVALLARARGEPLLAYVKARRRRPQLFAAACFIAAALLVVTPPSPSPPRQPTVTFLDVGEGAATLVQARDGPTALIDAGPVPLGRLLRAHGVDAVDVLVISHAHADHIAGLSDVIGRVKIRRAILPRPARASPALERLATTLASAGAVVERLDGPAVVTTQSWRLRLFATRSAGGADANQAENDCAIVAVVGMGDIQVLVPGDAEADALRRLDLSPCQVVGVPHHGSRDGFDEELLGRLRPQLAVIPVGENRYGHPTRDTLSLLRGSGVAVRRTDECGDIAVNERVDGTVGVELSRDGPSADSVGTSR